MLETVGVVEGVGRMVGTLCSNPTNRLLGDGGPVGGREGETVV